MFEKSWFFHSKPVPVRIQMIALIVYLQKNLKVWVFSFPFPLPFPCTYYYIDPQTWINSLPCFMLPVFMSKLKPLSFPLSDLNTSIDCLVHIKVKTVPTIFVVKEAQIA